MSAVALRSPSLAVQRGILGALLAVPTAAILQVIVQEILDERDRADS